jgi:hypothetical protein
MGLTVEQAKENMRNGAVYANSYGIKFSYYAKEDEFYYHSSVDGTKQDPINGFWDEVGEWKTVTPPKEKENANEKRSI